VKVARNDDPHGEPVAQLIPGLIQDRRNSVTLCAAWGREDENSCPIMRWDLNRS
jgi:hypothetical protein